MGQVEDLLKYALAQVGTAENPLGSNRQPYGAYIDSTDWYLYKSGDRTWRHLVNGYDFPGGSSGKEPTYQGRRYEFDP